MTDQRQSYPSDSADKFFLRFEKPGHRDRLKEEAKRQKRTLTKHLLHLIEVGEAEEARRAQAS